MDLVYIATPNRFHSEHARLALEARKHVLIEKPMTIALDAADVMIDAADRNGVLLGVNVKHSFEPRVARVRQMVASGELGRLRMINSWRFADWLYRPRTPEELTPEWGGGALWRQGPHQLDIIRTIGGGLVRSVRGLASAWDDSRRVTGAHAAYLDFEEGAVATAVFSGYDHYNSRELVYGMGSVDPSEHAAARAELRAAPSAEWEAQAARDERYGGERSSVQPRAVEAPSGGWILGGPMMISFDHADVRMSPNGLDVYGDESRWEIELRGPKDGRDGRIDSFYDAIVNGIRSCRPTGDGARRLWRSSSRSKSRDASGRRFASPTRPVRSTRRRSPRHGPERRPPRRRLSARRAATMEALYGRSQTLLRHDSL